MNTMTVTANEFVKQYIAIWGEDEVDNLLDKGFVPTLVEENGSLKWTWRLVPNRP